MASVDVQSPYMAISGTLVISWTLAMVWVSTTSLIKLLEPAEGCSSLRWVFGIPLRDHAYICPDCGMLADPAGIYAVTCQRSGFITRGHSVLRNAIIELFRRAGVRVEATITSSLRVATTRDERSADILVSNWHGKTVAVDFTIITPTRQSALAQEQQQSRQRPQWTKRPR